MRVLKKILVLMAALMLAASSCAWAADLNTLRSSSTAARDRIVFDFSEMPLYHVSLSEDGRELTFDFVDTNASAFRYAAVRTARINSVSYAARRGHFYVTVTMAKGMDYALGNLMNPARVYLDVAPKGAAKPQAKDSETLPPVSPAKSEGTAAGGAQPEQPKLPILKGETIGAGLMLPT